MRHLLAQAYRWVCPPSPLGQASTPPEIYRRFVTHYILLLNTVFLASLHIIKSILIPQSIQSAILYGLCSYGIIAVLCHWRRAFITAIVYTTYLSISTVLYIHQVALIGHRLNVFELVVLFFIPVWSAGSLLNLWGLWIVIGCLGGLFIINATNQQIIFLTVPGYPIEAFMLLIGVALILSLGIYMYRKTLKESDRSQELQDLNTTLERSIQDKEMILNEFGTVFESVQDALIVFNQQGEVVHQNAACTQSYTGIAGGLSMVDFLNSVPCSTLYHTPVTLVDFPAYKVLHGETGTPILRVHIQKAATDFSIVDVQAVPLYSAPDELFGVLTVLRDITQEYRTTFNLKVLRQVSHACTTGIALQTVAEAALTAICNGLQIEYGFIALRDPDVHERAHILASHTTTTFDVSPAELTISAESPLHFLRVMALGQQQCNIDLTQAAHRPTVTQAQVQWEQYGMMCCLPLQCNGTILGVLEVMRGKDDITPWDDVDCMLLTMIADEVAISLHRAQLYEEARRLAMYDPLTGLYNHRTLQLQLSAALENAHKWHRPASVIMLDIDHFRRFNELYGHDIGDAALKHVAHAIQRSLRTGDSGARYGGEEFTIILPDTGASEAGLVAERIREAIMQINLPNPLMRGTLLTITASLGHATLSQQQLTPAALLKAADIALYAAKHAGRNCVVAYQPQEVRVLHMIAEEDTSRSSQYDIEAVYALLTAIDLRDGCTGIHAEQVSHYAVAMGLTLKLPESDIEQLRIGGLIHDVGKIGIPDTLLATPEPLTTEEWDMVRTHTTIGESIIQPVPELHSLIPFVRWHHERLDGSGYPDGLAGADIPLLVQIVGVANAFAAFTAARPYHPARPVIEGLEFLRGEAASGRMDSKLVEILSDIVFGDLMSQSAAQAA